MGLKSRKYKPRVLETSVGTGDLRLGLPPFAIAESWRLIIVEVRLGRLLLLVMLVLLLVHRLVVASRPWRDGVDELTRIEADGSVGSVRGRVRCRVRRTGGRRRLLLESVLPRHVV